MSEFTISCTGCGQRITVNDEWIGAKINCPTCQVSIVVPDNPDAPTASSIAIAAPPGMPPPPPVPKVTRLSVSALTAPEAHAPAPVPLATTEQQGSAGYRVHMARKPKKSYTGVIVAVVAVVLLGGSAFLNRDFIKSKWQSWHGPTAAELAATNTPAQPAPPPELTASEIMAKVIALYQGLPTFSAGGKFASVLDMSAISPAQAAAGPHAVTADLMLKMNRPLSYRIDMTVARGTSNVTTIGWSSGAGDWLQTHYGRTKMQSHDQVFNSFAVFSDGVNGAAGDIVRLFIGETNLGLAKDTIEWTRDKDENLAGQVNYVLEGTVDLHIFKVWISRDSFLITQTQVVLDGTASMDDATIKAQLKAIRGKDPSLKDVADAKKAMKIKGTITQTYNNIQTNVTFAETDFAPAAPTAPARGGMQNQQPGGRATQIVNGRRRGG